MTGGVPLDSWLAGAARRTPNRIYLDDRHSGTRLTFAEVDERVDRLATALRERGVGTGDRVAILATDGHRYVESLWACLRVGATFVPLNVRLVAAEVETLLRVAEPRMIMTGDRYVDTVATVVERLRVRPDVVGYDGPATGVVGYEELLASGAPGSVSGRSSDDDVVALSFTSGTTGLPKGVLQSQRMLKWLFADCILCWETEPEEVYYSGAPLFHVAGLGMVLMGALMSYASVLAPQFDAASVAGWIRDGEITTAFLVPSMLAAVLDRPELGGGPFPGLRAVHYGAAPMPLALLRRAMDTFGCRFVQAFGAGTESGWNTVMTSADHRRALAGDEYLLGSVGRAAPGVELRICDDAWNDLPVGEVGEIAVRSDMTMSGYLGSPELTAQALRSDGWFRAGDMGRLDGDGYLYLVDRKKDMIIRGGENVYPAEIEHVLHGHPAIADVAVVGVPDPHWGEVPQAHVVLTAGTVEPGQAELEAFTRERLASYKVPRSWVFESELPRNASGKVLKQVLRSAGTP